VSPNENNRRTKASAPCWLLPTVKGEHRLITHKPNIVDVFGKDWLDVKEGEASIFRPENGNYKLVARVAMRTGRHRTAPHHDGRTIDLLTRLLALLQRDDLK